MEAMLQNSLSYDVCHPWEEPKTALDQGTREGRLFNHLNGKCIYKYEAPKSALLPISLVCKGSLKAWEHSDIQ